MKTQTNNDIARAVYLLSKDKKQAEQVDLAKRFVTFLSKKRLLSKAPQILSQLAKIINKEEGRVEAKVSSVTKLAPTTKSHLEHALKKRYAAKDVMFVESLDPRLIGGVKVEVNNEVIDLTVKNKIEKLQAHLIKTV